MTSTLPLAASATKAAAGFDKRASAASSLHTPGSGSFPSEMLSPMASSPGMLKRDDLKTPITPPSAYLDFLRNMSPAMLSPAPTSGGGRFSFGDGKPLTSGDADSERSLASPAASNPTSQPSLSRNTSYDSATSSTTTLSSDSASSGSSAPVVHRPGSATSHKRPESPRVIIPPSPFARPSQPRSARTPRRLQIPNSPLSQQQQPPTSVLSSAPSPYSTTPVSAAPWSASFSPRGHDHAESAALEPMMAKPGKVSVRQTITRTVTYCRTPLDPAPKGKRRRLGSDGAMAATIPPTAATADSKAEPALLAEIGDAKIKVEEKYNSGVDDTLVVPDAVSSDSEMSAAQGDVTVPTVGEDL